MLETAVTTIKDFEAKLLAIIQKDKASHDKNVGGKIDEAANQVTQLMDLLAQHNAALQQTIGQPQDAGAQGTPVNG